MKCRRADDFSDLGDVVTDLVDLVRKELAERPKHQLRALGVVEDGLRLAV